MGPRRFGLYFAVLVFAAAAWWWLRGSAPADTRPAIVPRERAVPIPTAPAVPLSTSTAIDAPRAEATPSPVGNAAPAARQTVTQVASTAPLGVNPSRRAPVETPSVPSAEMRLSLDRVRNSLRDYRSLFGENPVGTNAQIMQALNGDNPRQARLAPDGMNSNAEGELIDQWGTPIFFHQLSKDQMEIISAGPDKVMGTADDILVR